ncbi:DUF5682 family protein [Cytophagaceae bacterium YF14B1]|uniref:DUF5682 family protein n=1 Tax=Xanthocytophaga flava TaxID=3048013 RepID=A0AAE3UC29_9BACT|nr:DUF5682 family protein [Xanthocytophaga flavus]MDJ1486377.1 DUF5682 family protein [Xanthocytophaga flavus]
MELHILGIRHHGVGSAKNIVERLNALQPDILLVEGPPELDSVVQWVTHKELKPPVAVLAYNTEKPAQATFYPFAKFSPEWQAITYAHQKNVPVWMMDLPLAHTFGIEIKKQEAAEKERKRLEEEAKQEAQEEIISVEDTNPQNNVTGEELPSAETGEGPLAEYETEFARDPISYLAQVAGYDDGELWWEHHFEHKFVKNSSQDHFEGVMMTMDVLREHVPMHHSAERDDLREAYMRKQIRQAEKAGYTKCVVVCGAWHGPALKNYNEKSVITSDDKSLKALPSTKVSCTWIPWTNTRLGMFSGYGAGIVSPGWYEHLWSHGQDKGIRWLTRVARMFRDKKMDISTAHVIEAYRLAEALAAMRDLSRPGLMELNEATQTVLCFGDSILLKLVEEELIVGKSTIGKVPKELPKLPIQSDFDELRKKCRLDVTEANKDYELDLRKELDLNRSRFLHRLDVLDIKWGKKISISTKGTFKEGWRLRWQPEMEIELIEKGFWGNTILEACTKYLLDLATQTQSITQLAAFIQEAIPAELFSVIEKLLEKINELSTISSDILELMGAVSPLVDVSRYGNVRKTDLTAINQLVNGLLTRVCIGLPNACYGLDDETSNRMFEHIKKTDEAVRLLDNEELEQLWYKTLGVILDKNGINTIIIGCTCRLLFDGKIIDETETARRFGLALSPGTEPKDAAGWIEGFLKGSGTILLYDQTLWNLLYKWVFELEQDKFLELLPILRRTFSKFDPSERKQIGEKAKKGITTINTTTFGSNVELPENFNYERAAKSLETIKLLLGIA